MYTLSNRSKKNYDGLDNKLKLIIDIALDVSWVDFSITHGFRSGKDQFELYKRGRKEKHGKWEIVNSSKVITYIDGINNRSKHNMQPAQAFDFCIYIPNRNDLAYEPVHMAYLIGLFHAIAFENSIQIRSGANWDSDGILLYDQKLKDMPHIELIL